MEDVPKRKVNWLRVFLAIITVLGVIFVVGPGVIGYGVYQQIKSSNYTLNELGQNIHTLERKLEVSEANLSMQDAFNNNLLQMVERNTNDLLNCKTEKNKLEAETKYAADLCEQRIKVIQMQLDEEMSKKQELENQQAQEELQVTPQCTLDLEEKQKQLEEVQKQFNAFVQNTAKSVCCKQKVDNPKINSFSIINDKLVCLEEGGTAITCSLG